MSRTSWFAVYTFKIVLQIALMSYLHISNWTLLVIFHFYSAGKPWFLTRPSNNGSDPDLGLCFWKGLWPWPWRLTPVVCQSSAFSKDSWTAHLLEVSFLLHAVIKNKKIPYFTRGFSSIGDILSRKAPTYFGMLVALFHGSEKGWKVMPRPFNKSLRMGRQDTM